MNNVVLDVYKESGEVLVSLVKADGSVISMYSKTFNKLSLAQIYGNRILYNDELKDTVNQELVIINHK